MSSAWPELDKLIRELGDVCALPNAEDEPLLSTATLAVSKATTALAHAARARGRSAETALALALKTVEEARVALHRARTAIAASAARRPPSRAAAPAAKGGGAVEGQSDGTCPACGRAFVVRYRATTGAPVVAFPVACPSPKCDGVNAVEYPATAVEVTVEPSVAS
jgi:hypothetical protein